jgi:ABC-type dipeptide/oligopeptide/nickel transport system permease component
VIRLVLERTVASFVVVFGAVTLIFLILNWLPGDAASLVAGEGASAETIEHVRIQLGTDRPILRQYREYLVGLAHGDLGRSYVTREPVLAKLESQFPATACLALASGIMAILLGIGLGVLSAVYRGRWVDQVIQVAALFLVSIPPFWLGLLGILLFSVELRWLPVIGRGGVLPSVLPVSCLGLIFSVPLLRMVRNGIIEALDEPYVMTLRAKGLRARRIVYVHVLRNVLMSTITLLGVLVGELLSGLVIVETLFARQGLGRLAVEAVSNKDMPVVQGAILLTSVAYVGINLLVDISCAWIDPRVRAAAAARAR